MLNLNFFKKISFSFLKLKIIFVIRWKYGSYELGSNFIPIFHKLLIIKMLTLLCWKMIASPRKRKITEVAKLRVASCVFTKPRNNERVCHNWCTLIYFILYEWLLFSYKFIIFLFFWGCKGTIFYPYLTYVNPIHRLKFSIKHYLFI